ncbi:MAG: acyltransferase, partial [Clostridia bacterium]|nr:acyltransferase [Deltaproteobacteria bacterium]
MPAAPRSAGLDALRVLALVAVVSFHLGLGADWSVTSAGWIGVDLFFVLSGYLIGTHLFRELRTTGRIALQRFYARRAWRILPSYAVVVAIYFALPAIRERSSIAPLWKFATFTQNLGLFRREMGAFTHAWSLCVEEHFYLTLPLLALAANRFVRHRARIFIISIVSAIVIAIFVRVALWQTVVLPHMGEPSWHSELAMWMYYYSIKPAP